MKQDVYGGSPDIYNYTKFKNFFHSTVIVDSLKLSLRNEESSQFN